MERSIVRADCLHWLRGCQPDSVDLVATDPPYGTGYIQFVGNIRSVGNSGYDDTFKVETTRPDGTLGLYHDLLVSMGSTKESNYVSTMGPILTEIHRVLKPDGAVWWICDHNMMHVVRTMLDITFGPSNYRNSVVAKIRHRAQVNMLKFPPAYDVCLWYGKTPRHAKYATMYQPRPPNKIHSLVGGHSMGTLQRRTSNSKFGAESGHVPHWKGRHFPGMKWCVPLKLDGIPEPEPGSTPEQRLLYYEKHGLVSTSHKTGKPRYYTLVDKGMQILDLWEEPENRLDNDYTCSWPNRKPLWLMKRIIESSTNPGDLVVDPFAGSGTTGIAAMELRRNFVLVDRERGAVDTATKRLKSHKLWGTTPLDTA